jgi:hypothetical protein
VFYAVRRKSAEAFLIFRAYYGWSSVSEEGGFVPILEKEGPDDILFQNDGVPLHFHKKITDFIYRKFPEKWTLGTSGSLDRTLLYFSFLGYIKDAGYVPPLANTLPELAGRTKAVVPTATSDLR